GIVPNQYDKFYVNPHFFAQYANASSGLRQYSPKIYEFYQPYYSSQSSMVAAFTKGQLDLLPVSPSFLSLVKGTPGAYIYIKPSQVFCAVRINENETPLNITTFRQALSYATPYQTIDGTVYDGLLTPSSNTVPPCNVLWYNSSSPQYTYNMQKAKSMISAIPGMANSSGTLTYNGKKVTIQIQIAPGSETPCAAEIADEMSTSFAALGITTVIKEEAYTTMFNNIYETITGKGNFYQMAEYGQGTESGDPADLCALFINDAPAYFSVGCTLGPYTSLNFNGKHLSGQQVTTLLTNLSNELLQSDSYQQAIHISKEIQTLIIEEATLINLGYTTTIDAFQTNQFSNFTTENSNSLFSLYFTLMEVNKAKTTTSVSYKYNMQVQEKLTGALVEKQGDSGSITYTVLNKTTGLPVQGATVGVSVSSIAKGLINTTSNQLTTNSAGQATWKYKVFKNLNLLLQTTSSSGNIINLPDEEVNISATVNPPTKDIHTITTSTYLNIELINTNEKNNLRVTSTYSGKTHLYAGSSGKYMYTVTNSTGTKVKDANITVVMSGIPGSVTSSAFTFNTSTGNSANFTFTIPKTLSNLMTTYGSSGNPMSLYYQEINITAVASVGNQNQTGAGYAYNNVFVINPSLVMSYNLGSTSYTSGQTGKITFTVTENGTAVSGAYVNITSYSLSGVNVGISGYNLTTNSAGVAVFTFTVGDASSGSGSYVTANESIVAKASTSNSSVVPAYSFVNYTVTEKVVKPSSSNYIYEIIAIIAVVIVIVAVAGVYLIRKPKIPKN
ncbi:MAG: ABC transporter substrate-binding protein, partial [Cuniculiplasma divulgatum]